MKGLCVAVLALAALASSSAQNDDGQYRPERYGADDGRYRPGDEGRYYAADYNNFYRNAVDYNAAASRAVYNNYAVPSAVQYVTAQPFFNQNYYASKPVVRVAAAQPSYQFAKTVPVFQAPVLQSSIVASPLARYAAGSSERSAIILRQSADINENGYQYQYETENGINAAETGTVDSSVNKNEGGTKASGFYEYVGDDGVKYRVDYVADENGFRASGAHLPTPPPVPAEIARSLASRGL